MSSLEKLTEWNALKKVSLKLHLPTTLIESGANEDLAKRDPSTFT